MLLPKEDIQQLLEVYGIKVRGVLHVGAHECEEMPFYSTLGVSPPQVYWIDALEEKVNQAKHAGTPNMYQAVVSDNDDQEVEFKITDFQQSSSFLDLGTHEKHYDWVHVAKKVLLKTTTLDSWVHKNAIPIETLNFWNFDIQGAELHALRGALKSLQHPDILYLEVNTEEVYKGCGLLHEIDAFLKVHGFTRIRIQMTNAGWGDALYIKRVIPKVSLCIPTMRRWSFLKESIPKYLENPYIDEIVISDEDGADNREIFREFGASCAKLRLFSNTQKLGVFLNKQAAAERASHDWVCLIDSDNYAPPSYFDAWAAQYEVNNDLIVYAPSRTFSSKTHGGFDYRHLTGIDINSKNYKEFFKMPSAECCLNTANYIFNKHTFMKAKCFAGDNDCITSDTMYKNYLLFHLANATMRIIPKMEYDHAVHDGSHYINYNKYTNSEYFNGLYRDHPQLQLTLSEWQRTLKGQDQILYNSSEHSKINDEWVRFPIGMNFTFFHYKNKDLASVQIGAHEQLVLCAISDWTDERRRPCAPNRRSYLQTLKDNNIQNISLPQNVYFEALPHFKFVISPEGNGVDCHRHYEALMAGAIPIVEDHPGIREKYVGCPVLFTKDYSEINAAYLETKYAEMLTTKYDFSRLFLGCYDSKTQEEIRDNGNYWSMRHLGKKWYN